MPDEIQYPSAAPTAPTEAVTPQASPATEEPAADDDSAAAKRRRRGRRGGRKHKKKSPPTAPVVEGETPPTPEQTETWMDDPDKTEIVDPFSDDPVSW